MENLDSRGASVNTQQKVLRPHGLSCLTSSMLCVLIENWEWPGDEVIFVHEAIFIHAVRIESIRSIPPTAKQPIQSKVLSESILK